MSQGEYSDLASLAAQAEASWSNVVESIQEQADYEHSRDDAIFQTAELLRKMNDRMEYERLAQESARKKAKQEQILALEQQRKSEQEQQRIDRARFIIATTIGLLTLATTILFGIIALLS